MAFGEKIDAHPDKQELIERLLAGESVREAAAWLKQKYPANRRRWISYLTLQRYRQEHLNLKGQVLKEVKATAHELTAERVQDQRVIALRDSPEYDAAKTTIAKDILKKDQLILDIHDKIWQRIQLLEEEGTNYKNDAVICEYISQMRQLMMDYHKMVMDIDKASKRSEGPTNVQVIVQQAQDQINMLKKIVIEVLQEMSPELIPVFLEKVKEKMPGSPSAGNTTVNVRVG